jgi:hypothetical protein
MSVIPTNMRLFGEYLLGNEDPITEKDFTPDELKEIYAKVQRENEHNENYERQVNARLKTIRDEDSINAPWTEELANKNKKWEEGVGFVPKYSEEEFREVERAKLKEWEDKSASFNKDRNKTSVTYGADTLVDESIGFLETIKQSYTSPAYNVDTSLGSYNAYKNEDGTVTIEDTYDMFGNVWKPGSVLELKDFLKELPSAINHPEDLGQLFVSFAMPGRKRDVVIQLNPEELNKMSEEQKYTTKGRKVYKDEETGENFSERTVTFETKYGWVTIPTVSETGDEIDQRDLERFIEENGPVDPLTGEELPVFDSEPEASEYAKMRSDSLMPAAEATMPGYDNDSPELEGAVRALEDQEPVEMYHGGMMMGGCGDPMCPDCGGMMVGMDGISGNPIPPGSNEMNVRDDIPAVLSDGEYVVPADVVRWHGLKHLMDMRDEAKFGLMAMYAEGQIQDIVDEEMEYDDMPCEGCDGEDCDCEYGDYETEEGNVIEEAMSEIEEETMEVEEEEDSSDGKNTYRPSVKIALMKR